MTKIRDLLGKGANVLVQNSISVGDVHILPLGKEEGITPKGEALTRRKFFIVLGFDVEGDIIGGIVINSNINLNLPSSVTDYLMPVTVQQMPFLKHRSFINCSRLKTVKKDKFNHGTYIGHIDNDSLLESIKETVIESPYANIQQLKEFGVLNS